MPYGIGAVFALPGEQIPIEIIGGGPVRRETVAASLGQVVPIAANQWRWHAPPTPGLYQLAMSDAEGRQLARLNAFVMVPAGRIAGGRLNGYTIGRYPPRAVKNNVLYAPPDGFVEVTAANEDALLSPHFRLKDFLCKQVGAYPKYVALREALPVKLERILLMLQTRGYEVTALRLMSGYRTPIYNRAIGNVAYSMHLWGGAADVFVDADFNGDGRIDLEDAVIFSRLIGELDHGSAGDEAATGGLGAYGSTTAHGPFVHVDVRPTHARWGG